MKQSSPKQLNKTLSHAVRLTTEDPHGLWIMVVNNFKPSTNLPSDVSLKKVRSLTLSHKSTCKWPKRRLTKMATN